MNIHPLAATALFLLLGVLIYFIDSKIGVSLSRTWYNLTHKDPRPEGSRMGFIAGHKTSRKLIAGVVIGTLGFLLQMMFFEKTSLSVVLLEAASLFVGITLGFLIAPVLMSFLPKKIEAASDYVDKVESGQIDVRDDLAGAASEFGDKVKDAATGGVGKAGDVIKNIKEEIEDIGENLGEGIRDLGDEVRERTGFGDGSKSSKSSHHSEPKKPAKPVAKPSSKNEPASGSPENPQTDSAAAKSKGTKGSKETNGPDEKDKPDWRKGVKKFLDK